MTHGCRADHLHRPDGTVGRGAKERAESHRRRETRKEEEECRGEALRVETVGDVGFIEGEAHLVVAGDSLEHAFEEGWVLGIVSFSSGGGHGQRRKRARLALVDTGVGGNDSGH